MDVLAAHPSVFISYSHLDEGWRKRLVKHLRVLEGDLEVWDDRRIAAGDDWLPAIGAAIAKARAAVLLVSADFLTSGFIGGTEIPALLRRRESEGLLVFPVIVHPCAWQAVDWLARMQCRPADGKELSSFTKSKAEKQLATLALEIRDRLRAGSGREEAPSPVSRLHNLPYSRLGDLFAGRQAELDALADDAPSTVLSGLGGIGKTRLAVEYAWSRGSRHTAAWFVRADSPENLRRNLAALAGPELLNLPEWEKQVEEATVGAVKRWLREHAGWLMILDGVDTPEAADAVLKLLPSLSNGRFLLTSRLTIWPAGFRVLSLGTLTSGEAVDFLLRRTQDGRIPAEDDASQAAALAEALDGLPLALEQAAALIRHRRKRLADYNQACRSEVLQWHDPRAMESAPIAITWQQTFQRLSPTAATLLRLMALLAPDPIPASLFEQGNEVVEPAVRRLCEETGKETDGRSIADALDELAAYSLLSRQDGENLLVHRMVQEVLRDQIPPDRKRDWIETALRLTDRAFPSDSHDVRTWAACDRLSPHALRITARADKAAISDPTSRLMDDLGVFFHHKGLYPRAEVLLRRALAINESSLGSAHPEVANSLNNLALLLQATQRSEEAEPLLRRALAIDEAAFEPRHPNLARDLTNLSQLLQNANRLHDAEPLVRRALDLSMLLLGSEHPQVADALTNLALLLQETKRPEEAEPLLRRALAIDETFYGLEHPSVARDLNNLAQSVQDRKQPGEAEPLMRRALAIDEAALGTEHPDVARDLHNLALLLQDLKRPGEAEPLLRHAVALYDKILGKDHANSQTARRNLENLLAERSVLEFPGNL